MMRSSSEGNSGFRRDGGTGDLWRIASKIAADVEPQKGRAPVAISYNTAPKENRSVRASSSSPMACSGDMYITVPMAEPGLLSNSSADTVGKPDAVMLTPAPVRKGDRIFARPKSRTFTCPARVQKI